MSEDFAPGLTSKSKFDPIDQSDDKIILMRKKCVLCNKIKLIKDFHINKQNIDNRHSYCKKCHKKWRDNYYLKNKEQINKKHIQYNHNNKKQIAENNKKWRQKNKVKYQDQKLKYKYNITLDKKNQMIVEQSGRCACCGDVLGVNPKNICVDHDHIYNIIRKILCMKCNIVLGLTKENIDIILKLLEYIKYCNKLKEQYGK
jgi:hypothetical protein